MSGSKISLSLGGTRKPPPPTNGVKRSRAALHEEDDDGTEFGKPEIVSHFDKTSGGAIDEGKRNEDPKPLVIPSMANRDWKEAANKRKRQKSSLPEGRGREADIDQRMAEVEAAEAARMPSIGLNLLKKQKHGDELMENRQADAAVDASEESTRDDHQVHAKPKTDDELAMDALLGITTTDKQLVIEPQNPMTETDAFHHDFGEAPDMATLDDYARVPVEDFGTAMLRGMGWKEGEGIGSQKGRKLPKTINKLPERRANLLGIGAKEDTAIAQEMGVWGKAARDGKAVKIYNPVLLRNKMTGEMYTEEELQKKREKDERTKYEEEFERKEIERERRRRKEEDHDRDSRDRRREKDNHRDREREKDNRRDRDRDRRKYDDESDEEYYRRKEKEQRRRRERSEDEHRSRHHDNYRHRDSDRARRDRDHDRRR